LSEFPAEFLKAPVERWELFFTGNELMEMLIISKSRFKNIFDLYY